MKRRNFLSSLLAAPLALKARLAQFFVRKREPCGAPILPVQPKPHVARQREILQMLAGDSRTAPKPLLFCSLPRGHKGPHTLANRALKLTRLSFGDSQGPH